MLLSFGCKDEGEGEGWAPTVALDVLDIFIEAADAGQLLNISAKLVLWRGDACISPALCDGFGGVRLGAAGPAVVSFMRAVNTRGPASAGSDLQELLQERTTQLLSTQRNYDTLSRMTQLKQQEADELRQRYDEESARAVSLGVQLEDMAARAMKAEAAASRLQAVQDQLTALQAEHAKLKYTASISASSMASTQEQLQSLQQVAEAADFKAAAAQKEAEAWRGSEATCRVGTSVVYIVRVVFHLILLFHLFNMVFVTRTRLPRGFAGAQSECARLRGEVSRSQAGTRAALASLKETQSALSMAQAATQAAEATGAELATRLAGREDEIARLKGTIRALEDSLHEAQSSSRATEVALATSRSQTNVVQGQLHSVTRSLELTLEGRQQLEGQLKGLGRELQAVKASLAHTEGRSAQMQALLADAEEQQQASAAAGNQQQRLSLLLVASQAVLMKGLEASEGLTRLQVQLASNKATLTDTRRQLQQAEADHAVALGAERSRTHRAEQQAAELAAQAAQTRHKAATFLQHTITRLERSFEALAALQAAVGRGLGLLLERQEHSLGGLTYRLQVWDAQWLEVQEQIGQMAAKTQQLAALVAKHSTKQASTEQADAASLEKLRSQVVRLEKLLAAEQTAKAALSQASRCKHPPENKQVSEENDGSFRAPHAGSLHASLYRRAKQRQEASHADALAALRTAADERVEAERLRLSSRLRGIESELHTLKESSEKERAAATQLVALERTKMTQQVETALSQRSELEREVQQLRAAMLQAEHTQLAQLNLRHAGEVEALQRQVQDLKMALGSVNSRVVLVWEAHQQLLGDMAVVAAHLASMGWSVRQGEPGAGQALGQEDGCGAVLLKLAALLRLHFSYITEAVQEVARKPLPQPLPAPSMPGPPQTPGLERPPSADWKLLARELKATVAKVLHVEESLASNMTCMLCLEVLKQPTMCIPCGHNFCKACLHKRGGRCGECNEDQAVSGTIANGPLEAICSKYDYKLGALQSIQRAIQNSAAQPC
ncbi:hypothetical protein QJQ45_015013 [Haematococcus lacustris]|nr:hypothetical protein QJQ45_015013 [Haematococcus lacustris]